MKDEYSMTKFEFEKRMQMLEDRITILEQSHLKSVERKGKSEDHYKDIFMGYSYDSRANYGKY